MCWVAESMSAPPNTSPHSEPRPAAALPAKLDAALRSALVRALGEAGASADPALKAATQARFGDFQANFAMGLAKSLGRNPRDLAQEVLTAGAAALDPLCEKLEVAGPGFVNITLRASIIADALHEMDTPALGVPAPGHGRCVAVDLCGVNVAKQLHVGHLRASIIGDSMARLHERLGWTVFRQNHLGDWG
ncbi:MAG: arginine--tRNA ligase, partial [Phycisphaerae bacterium]|nr:arginine--tRNA ligase [Phycisphaerae bacterium]